MKPQLLVGLWIRRDHFRFPRYIGSDHILALVRSGAFVFESKDGAHRVGEGECAVFRAGVLYRREVLSPVTMYFFRYKSDTPFFAEEHIIFRDQARIASTLQMLERLAEDVFLDTFELQKNLFSDLLTQYEIEHNGEGAHGEARDTAVTAAIAYLSENLHKKPNLTELGEKIGTSYITLLRRFRLKTGMTPSEYLLALRSEKAKQMLSETDLLVKEIAAFCGFENEYYFSNFFKKRVGVSPLTFRALL